MRRKLLPWQRALIVLEYVAILTLIVAALYWAQIVLIPVALAIFLAFLLTPLVRGMQQRGIGRIPAVLAAVGLVVLVLIGLTWFLGYQFTALAADLPAYSENIKAKARNLRQLGAGEVMERLENLMNEVEQELKPDRKAGDGKEARDASAEPQPVVIKADRPSWLGRTPTYLGSSLDWLGGIGLALVLLIFLLLNREDMRNRLLRLVGENRLSYTTRAMTEAGERISRYLLMQLIINATYGIALGLGLLLLGVEYALLWGFLAAVLRYIPYLGPWLAAVFPVALSLAISPGWLQPLGVIGFIVVLELISNNFMEPWLYGQSIGVSEVGLLVCAAFWTFLWGPIGLVLSAPLTVCLVILGKYVPQLAALDILLGDQPVMSPSARFYQRLLARDTEEAKELVKKRLEQPEPEKLADELYLPALHHAVAAHKRGDLSEEDEQFVVDTISSFLRDLHRSDGLSPEPVAHPGPLAPSDDKPRVKVLACAARNDEDEVPLAIVRTLLDPERWEMDMISADTLTGEAVQLADEADPAAVLIGCVLPGIAHSRYLCKRFRARFPELKIIVGCWGRDDERQRTKKQLLQAGADEVVFSLLEARDRLNSLQPILTSQTAED